MASVLELLTGPTIELITPNDVANQIMIEPSDEMVSFYISSAQSIIEHQVGPLLSQVWVQYESEWPSGNILELKKPRVSSITSIKYKDEDGVESTFSSSNYSLNSLDSYNPCVVLKRTSYWPTDSLYEVNPIAITFTCGYASPQMVPIDIKICALMLVGYLYENREADSKSFPVKVLDSLLSNHRYR